ncbi:MAG: preprotein translocase subunit SecA [Acidimicrobiales bacterium]
MKLLDKILKAGEGKRLKSTQAVVAPINALEGEYAALSDDALAAKTGEFRSRLDQGADLDDLLFEAFATVRETARREIGQFHYEVQLMGGAALHWGWVAEMKTGEGKTLVSTLPVYLNALTGRGVHQITVNDYLASRDHEWMGQIHRRLGLTCGLVVPGGATPAHKRTQYGADITYGTNNEFGFDYLRDNMARNVVDRVQRGHVFAIVDEIDSILIDEARTPLIISGKVKGAADLYYRFADIAKVLERDVHYDVDEEKRIVAILDEGVTEVEELLEIENLYDGVQQDLVHQLNAALRAKELFRREKDYLVVNGEVKIVDEFTGRVLDGRRWSDGLHQAVEAKEGVRIKEEQQTLATVTLQNYFRMYEKLSGMTGTAQSDAAELENTYGLPVVQVPTNKPIARMDQADLIFKTEEAKFSAVVDDIEQRVEHGQPVLVGTASVEKSEVLGAYMTKRGIEHEILNAKQHFREADLVAQAGQPGRVTVATNMAGRGVDIVLGGNAEKLAERDTYAAGLELDSDEGQEHYAERLDYWTPICEADGSKVRDAGGLYVLGTERHDSRRIDNQLRGRSGRQGEPGESRFYLSLEDELMRIFSSGASSWVMDKALAEDEAIESKTVTKSVERAQVNVEQRNAETRKNVLKYDEVYNEQRKVVYGRRLQMLEQSDLRDDTIAAIDDAAATLVRAHCVSELDDAWDTEALAGELAGFWPTEFTAETLADARNLEGLIEMIAAEGRAHYEKREAEIGAPILRQVERQIMLQLIDQRWREHLTEMDYLRSGINLRAMGQKDPLVEWQREGFEMFADMMRGLNVDFVRYVMHVQVTTKAAEPAAQAPATVADDTAADDTAADDTAAGAAFESEVVGSAPVVTETTTSSSDSAPVSDEADEPASQTVVKDEWDKTPRNAPCPCGSGKKFKHCHG